MYYSLCVTKNNIMLRQIVVILSILLTVAVFSCQQETAASKEVLFVCTHGAARSPIAAAYFNKMSKAQGLNYHAVFRGTKPDDKLTEETIQGLTNDAFEVSAWNPEKVAIKDMNKAYKIVTFDCTLPSERSAAKVEQWNGTPSISKDYEIARNNIKARVEKLVNTLAKE